MPWRPIRPARSAIASASEACWQSDIFVGALACAGFIFEPPTITVLVLLFGLAGIHGAFQQSLEKSLAAEILPKEIRGSGFGVLATVNGIGDLISSIAVGALWSSVGPAA